MLIKNLYKILSIEREGDKVNTTIFIYKEHEVFKGHFPNDPVMPGVCMIQIIKEITEQVVDKKLFMAQSNNIKFKAIINPETHPELQLQLTIKNDREHIKVKNVTKFGDTVALQMSATFHFAAGN